VVVDDLLLFVVGYTGDNAGQAVPGLQDEVRGGRLRGDTARESRLSIGRNESGNANRKSRWHAPVPSGRVLHLMGASIRLQSS
jgi:hypothetical protein